MKVYIGVGQKIYMTSVTTIINILQFSKLRKIILALT